MSELLPSRFTNRIKFLKMKHYRAIVGINYLIIELESEIKKLNQIPKDSEHYSGYVFVKNDIENINKEIKELTETMKFLINIK